MAKKTRTFQPVASDLPPVWKPNVGDTLEGIFLGSKLIGKGRKRFLTHQIKNEETGEVQSFSGAIADRYMRRIPQGTAVRITSLEEVDTENGPAKNFSVEADSSVHVAEEPFVQELEDGGPDEEDEEDEVEAAPRSRKQRDAAATTKARAATRAS